MTDKNKSTSSPDMVRDGAARILEVHAQVTQALKGGESALRDFARDEKQHPAARRAVADWLERAPAPPWGMAEVVQIFAAVGNAVRIAELERLGQSPD